MSERMGFGLILHQRGEDVVVARALLRSPAAKAGIPASSRIVQVDDYELSGPKGDAVELAALLQLDPRAVHEIDYVSPAGRARTRIAKARLARLLAFDFDAGGAAQGYCVGCRTCRSLIQGATGCGSGCPGDRCLIA